MVYTLFGILISIWLIFFEGAERIENTLLGYFEFGFIAEKADYIRVGAWIGLITSVVLIVSELI